MFRLPLLLLLLIITAAAKTVPLPLTNINPKKCFNLGSWYDEDGPFEAELGFVKYRPEPRIIIGKAPIARTSFDKAFQTQRSAKIIRFTIKVAPEFRYTVTTAHAEIVKKFCKKGARNLEILVNGPKKVVDVFDTVGCRTATFVEFKNVKAWKGFIKVRITGLTGPAAIAGICIRRGAALPQKSRPSKSPSPSPSQSTTPAPSQSNTPAPSPSNTPAPSPSNTPTPSNSPTPSPSKSPAPTQSSSPNPPFLPSKCTQKGCMNFEGHGDYKVIGNSMSYDEDRDNCRIKRSSFASLKLPAGAVVKKAVLYWSASGYMTKAASSYLNSNYVPASRTYYGGSSGYHFYGAEADVTHLVRGSGEYTVSRVWYDNRGRLCYGNAAYAAWSLVVVYELRSLPRARINVCTNNFKFTFPSGTYSSVVDCIRGSKAIAKAKTTVVTFESDNYKGEHFFINGRFLGDNLFRGTTAPNLDIVEFDITQLARKLVSRITYTVKSYYVRTRFGGAIEGLFMPVLVVYHTIH